MCKTHCYEGLTTYPAVSTVCTSPLFRGLVDLDVFDDEIAGVEAFGISICLCVLEETEEEIGGFDGPATLCGSECLGCGNDKVSICSTLMRVCPF
jgi:hypothetical protein